MGASGKSEMQPDFGRIFIVWTHAMTYQDKYLFDFNLLRHLPCISG